jgi:hypothetical protein
MDGAHRIEPTQPGSALDHVVLRMDLQPQPFDPAGERRVEVLGLEAEPGPEKGRHGNRRFRVQRLISINEPMPWGVFIVTHVPAGTYFQALGW